MADKSILIVDDEQSIRENLHQVLHQHGFDVHTAEYGKQGLALLLKRHVDVMLLDLRLADMNGIEVLQEINRLNIKVVIIIITAYGDVRSVVAAMKLGAFDFLAKPFGAHDIKIAVDKAFKYIGLENRIDLLTRQVDSYQYGELIANSRCMHALFEMVEKIAMGSSSVLIQGETGTGKELFAGLIHRKSPRAKKSFITVDCTSLPENLMESELFGHEKGAFTGADVLKRGLFEIADGGTVFLDEVGELPSVLQSKILRVLETRTFRRIGAETYLKTDVQIIAATNRNLQAAVKQGRFRSDLFYRLNVIPLALPPLRDRKEDILPLVEHFVAKLTPRIGKEISTVTTEALALLTEYEWPGNIRELKNVIERMVITGNGDTLRVEDLPSEIKGPGLSSNSCADYFKKAPSETLPDFRAAKKKLIDEFEKDYLKRLLEKNKGNVSQCARDVDMHRSSLKRLMRKYNL